MFKRIYIFYLTYLAAMTYSQTLLMLWFFENKISYTGMLFYFLSTYLFALLFYFILQNIRFSSKLSLLLGVAVSAAGVLMANFITIHTYYKCATSDVAQKWEKVDGKFWSSKVGAKAGWKMSKAGFDKKWEMEYKGIKFFASPTPFRHLGFFPEQASHWDFIEENLQGQSLRIIEDDALKFLERKIIFNFPLLFLPESLPRLPEFRPHFPEFPLHLPESLRCLPKLLPVPPHAD